VRVCDEEGPVRVCQQECVRGEMIRGGMCSHVRVCDEECVHR
jgi:hypothetical protein